MTYSKAENSFILHIDNASEKISRHIYGHFAEHLGRCIYDGFYVGEENSIVRHTNGLRIDIIEALKKLNIPNLRWPGGCFADTYHWRDGIGPKHKRPTIVNRWWGNVTEDNSFGTHDFLELCRLLNAEPYISVNVGSGTVQELADWVQYVNFDGRSPMSDLRKQYGRDLPWQVKFWGIGNEAWGCGGNMNAAYYANIYRQYVTFMTGWSNTEKLFRIASGANSADYHWTEILMRDIPHHLIEGVALHHYAVTDWSNKGPATGFSEAQYFDTMKAAWRMDEIVTKHSAIMDTYDPQNNVSQEKALAWINQAIAQNNTFATQRIKAGLLKQTGKTAEGDKIMNEALTTAREAEINAYGYELLGNGQTDKAIEIFILNTERYPKSANAWDSLGEAYATKGDKTNAIKNFKKALSLNPPANVKANSEKFLKQFGAM